MAAKRTCRLLVTVLSVTLASGVTTGISYAGVLPGWLGGKPKPVGSTLPVNTVGKPGVVQKVTSSVGDTFSGMTHVLRKSTKKAGEIITPEQSPNDNITLASGTGKESPDLYVSVARLQERAGNLDGAIEQYRHALDVDADHLGARLGLARLYDRQNQLDQAAHEYREAARRHPTEASPLNDLGLCFARQGKFGDSVECLQRAVQMEPEKPLYRNNLATVLVELGRNREALDQLTVVHGRAAALYNLGFLLNKRGQKQAALEHFRQALAVDANFEAARRWSQALEVELGSAANLASAAPVPSVNPARLPATVATAPLPATPSLNNPMRYNDSPAATGYRADPVPLPPAVQPPSNDRYATPSSGSSTMIRPLPPLSANNPLPSRY